MSEHYRALIVILVLASIVFAFAKAPATATAMTVEDFKRRRNCWYFVTLAGFLSPNFWIFVLIVSIFLFYAARREHNVVALFFFLFLALPQISVEIPGFAGIRYITKIDYLRILILFVFLPKCIVLRRQEKRRNENFALADLLFGLYLTLNVILRGQDETLTGILRLIFSALVDLFLPYYAITRSLKDLKSFRDSLMSFVIAALIVSIVAIFEISKSWLVYTSLDGSLGVDVPSIYLQRAGLLRAIGTSGHAIVLGYVLAIAIGLYLYVQKITPYKVIWITGLLILIGGEISPLSKGPWVGVATIYIIFIALDSKRLVKLAKFLLVAPPLIMALLISDAGSQIIGFLPFIGTIDEGSQAYRQQLFDTSIQIIFDNPLFGSSDYLLHMENMRQGQGIIDLVNTYLIVALNTGLIGLALYSSFFLIVLVGIFRGMQLVRPDSEYFTLGQSLFATLVGILVIIATCSPIFHVPLLLVAVAGMGRSYFAMLTNMKDDVALRSHKPPRPFADQPPPFDATRQDSLGTILSPPM